jgi:hypothetical protein
MEKTLIVALGRLFQPSVLAQQSATLLAERLDEVLYTVSLEHFGTKQTTQHPRKAKRDAKNDSAMKAFRHKKRALKKAWKKLDPDINDPAYKALKTEWRKTLKEHNKLSRSVKRSAENRRLKSQQRKFDADPFLFGQKLFEKKAAGGEPQFTAKEAFDFFSSNYRDTERATPFKPLDEMVRPPLPSHLFSENCPTIAELKASVAETKRRCARTERSFLHPVQKVSLYPTFCSQDC